MFASESPCRSSSEFSTRSGQPASAVARPAWASMDLMPAIPPGCSMMPSVTAAGVNEWPVPVIRTVRPCSPARRTMAATSSGDRGVTISLGSAQFNMGRVIGPALAGFAILAGMWPFHTWAPTGHVAAPTAASMLLAGQTSKGYSLSE